MIHINTLFDIALIGFILDLLLGDPVYRYHPVRIIGHGISSMTNILRKIGSANGKAGGLIMVILLLFIIISSYVMISLGLFYVYPVFGILFDIFIFYSCLALKDLIGHLDPVILSLKQSDLPEARKALAKVVGRDVHSLDEKGIIRAGIETMAENFVDGFLSPFFWYLAGGLMAEYLQIPIIRTGISMMLVFKVASTFDSMVGYKNKEFIKIGWAGAKLDDLMNFIPARLSLIILFFGAAICHLHPISGLQTALRDRLKHESPNAAHGESFVAGALGVRLAGPVMYPEGQRDKSWLGHEFSDPDIKHMRQTFVLLKTSGWISILLPLAFSIIF